MKKVKIISLLVAVIIPFLLNISIISSNGKVEEVFVNVNTGFASADGQCYLSIATCRCMCDLQVGYYCAAKCIVSGQECEYYDDQNQ